MHEIANENKLIVFQISSNEIESNIFCAVSDKVKYGFSLS